MNTFRAPTPGDANANAAEFRRARLAFGTHTGNCEDLANRIASDLADVFPGLAPEDLDNLANSPPEAGELLLIVTSSFGDGEAPFNGEMFWEWIEDAPDGALKGVAFAVLALGDRSYPDFCGFGRKVDESLARAGGERLTDRVDCDVEFESGFLAWAGSVHKILRGVDHVYAPAARPKPAAPAGKPGFALVTENRQLNGDGSSKYVAHVSLRPPAGFPQWHPGDSVDVTIVQPPGECAALLDQLDLDGETPVKIDGGVMSLFDALCRKRDIGVLAARRLSDEPPSTGSWLRDISTSLPPMTPQELVDKLPPLAPRAYSIATSPVSDPGRIDLCVSRTVYALNGREIVGAGSGWMCSVAVPGNLVLVRLRANPKFRLPQDPQTPIIMVGPGTGIAPFRGFLRERVAQGAGGKAWLFFGDRNRAHDALYADELKQFVTDGVLTRSDAAWSRDQDDKHYVQHDLARNAADLRDWLSDGAALYVCGDAGMAQDVHRTLVDILAEGGGNDRQSAEAWLRNAASDGRYCRDVY